MVAFDAISNAGRSRRGRREAARRVAGMARSLRSMFRFELSRTARGCPDACDTYGAAHQCAGRPPRSTGANPPSIPRRRSFGLERVADWPRGPAPRTAPFDITAPRRPATACGPPGQRADCSGTSGRSTSALVCGPVRRSYCMRTTWPTRGLLRYFRSIDQRTGVRHRTQHRTHGVRAGLTELVRPCWSGRATAQPSRISRAAVSEMP